MVSGLHNSSIGEYGQEADSDPVQVRSDVGLDFGRRQDMTAWLLDTALTADEPDVYFYHSDHLGSASWITDASGTPVQHLQHLPYGEPYINQRTTGYNERFTFTGKERDEETGYGYFGARYMDYELMTMWLSVAPMADKYPSLSPYNYCAWNPIRLIDPDGREIGDYYSESGKHLGSDGINDGKVYIVPFKSDRKKVKSGDFNVEKYELPSVEAREQMCNYLESSDHNDNLREYGGSLWEDELSGRQEIRPCIPGERWDGVSPTASVATNVYGDDEFSTTGKNLLTYFHSHFSGKINGRGLRQYPSGIDDGLQNGDVHNVMKDGNRLAKLPYNIMAAMGDRKVFLYTSVGVKCEMDLDVFRTVGR